jgi:hypothetical protein
MTRGRKPEGAELVGRLEGSDSAKARLRLILDVLAGRRAVGEACRQLGLSDRRFHELRCLALQAALGGLEPRPAGRPAQQPGGGEQEAALRATIRDLQLDLRASRVREEIALTMPDLLRRPARGEGAQAQRRRARRGTSGGRGGCGPSARTAGRPANGAGAWPRSARPGGASGASAPAPSPSAAGRAGSASP